MMFEEDRTTLPRAYVALPLDHRYEDYEKDLLDTIQWCLDQADGNAAKVGIQLGHKDDLESEPLLADFVASGAKLYPDFRGKMAALPSGPVLMYRPFDTHLWAVETKRMPAAVAAFGITGPDHNAQHSGIEHMVGCQPWVTAFNPLHLGGPVIQNKSPMVADRVVAVALDYFTGTINSSTGLSDSRDRSTVIEGLTKLRKVGHDFDPNDLLAGALAKNWRGDAAVQLRDVAAEINAGKRKQFTPRLRPEIVEIWREEAAK
ncbi:hypothetical protein MB46_18630 [Arthrobacter alpinus]|uniref:hypothetical protein n=1 Tax=Arthrobacter alpinus TaxID=656366 RepID=UPI0005C9B0BC|nr:hypothetical protein [Arthrobacter alpinus]ALV47208.1 hypothetical protein MB46_18630 [Arthrobacter alpinus]